jgi:hypothetical protein
MLLCPICDAHISSAEEIQISRIITCSNCLIPLEVISQAQASVRLKRVEPQPISELVEGDWAD